MGEPGWRGCGRDMPLRCCSSPQQRTSQQRSLPLRRHTHCLQSPARWLRAKTHQSSVRQAEASPGAVAGVMAGLIWAEAEAEQTWAEEMAGLTWAEAEVGLT